jgi:hypothetical protein
VKWKDELFERYRHLFRRGGYPTVGDGWQDLVEKAFVRIDAAAEGQPTGSLQILQIKEKFGTLRIYYGHRLPDDVLAKVEEAVKLAEARSRCTCETCGAAGQLYNKGGWRMTRCERHAEGEPVKPPHGDAALDICYVLVDGKMRVTKCRRYDREGDVFVDTPLPPGEEGLRPLRVTFATLSMSGWLCIALTYFAG